MEMATTRYEEVMDFSTKGSLRFRPRVILMPTARGMGTVEVGTVIPGRIPVLTLPRFLRDLERDVQLNSSGKYAHIYAPARARLEETIGTLTPG